MSALTWDDKIQYASTSDEVVHTCLEFLATLSPAEIGALPPACRPFRVADADDVASYALSLAMEQCEGSGGESMRRLRSFFAAAAARNAQLLGHARTVINQGASHKAPS